jgi:hypothetical protein
MVSIWSARWPAVTGCNELPCEIVGSFDVFADRRVVDALAGAVDGSETVETVMRPLPVVEMLPFRQALLELRIVKSHRRPELLERRLLDTFDLAIDTSAR